MNIKTPNLSNRQKSVRKTLICLVGLFLASSLFLSKKSFGQEHWFNERIKIQLRYLAFTDLGKYPLAEFSYDYDHAPFYLNLGTFIGEPMFSVLPLKDKAAVFVSTPVALKLHTSDAYSKDIYVSLLGPLVSTGIFANFSYGFGSTYNNISSHGILVGAGIDRQTSIIPDPNSTIYIPTLRFGVTRTINSMDNSAMIVLLEGGIPKRVTTGFSQDELTNIFLRASFRFKFS